MAMKNDHYTYRVTWSEEDQEHVGLCAEFPSLSWLAKTPEAALKGIRKVVEDVIKDMKENDERVYKAIMVLFESKEEIEIFNKKAIYLYLREITGLNTKQVVNSLNKFREYY